MKNTITCLLLLLGTLAVQAQDFSALRLPLLSPTQMERDLDLLWQGIDQYHSGAYWYTSRDSLQAAFRAARATCQDSLTVLGFYRQAARLLALTREDHANMALPAEVQATVLNQGRLFPISVAFLDRKMYAVYDGSTGEHDLRGQEIVRINGRTPAALVQEIGELFGSDGYIERVKYNDLNSLSFALWYYYEFGKVDRFDLVYRTECGLDSLSVTALPLDKIREQLAQRYTPAELA
ncbi:MAG: hypothetical protein AAGJ82_11355, partial [Bacteroidota bacterium]